MIPAMMENIRYRGLTLLIQTEDGGPGNPHIVSQAFFGGSVIAEKKEYYHDVVQDPKATLMVEKRMREQHRRLVHSILAGEYDATLGISPAAQPVPVAATTEEKPAPHHPVAITEKATAVFAGSLSEVSIPAPFEPSTSTAAPGPEEAQPRLAAGQAAQTASLWEGMFGASRITNRPLTEVIIQFLEERKKV